MLIGNIPGEVAHVVTPARRTVSAALVRRADGFVHLIDTCAHPPLGRVHQIWSPTRATAPAADARWLTASMPVVLTTDFALFVMERRRGTDRFKVASRLFLTDEARIDRGLPHTMSLLTSQDNLYGGRPYVIAASDAGVVKLTVNDDYTLAVEWARPWAADAASRLCANGGVLVPWVTDDGFLRGRHLGTHLTVFRTTPSAGGPQAGMQARAVADLPLPDPQSRYPLVAGCLPVMEAGRPVGQDVLIVTQTTLLVKRFGLPDAAETPATTVLQAEPGTAFRSVDMRNGRACVGSAESAGGAVDLIDWGTGDRVWRFETDSPPQDVCLLTDPLTGRVRTAALTDDGDVYLWTCGWPDRTHRTQGSTPASVRPSTAVSIRTLDLE